jgi:hypothetical protein
LNGSIVTRLVKIGEQVLPLRLQSVGVEDGELVILLPEPPMTYRGPIAFSFSYIGTVFSVQFLEIGKAARLRVDGNIARLPPPEDRARRNRVLALIDIVQEDVGGGLSLTAEEGIRFAAETPLSVPVSAEHLMVGLTRTLAWHKPILRLIQEQAAA